MATAEKEVRRYQEVPIGNVKPSKDNTRMDVGDVEGLATSIKAHGILEPLVVVLNEKKDGYDVVAGERRLAAAKAAGLTTIPVIVRDDLGDREIREARLIENLQREDLNIIEEASAYKQLLEMGYGQRELAGRIGVSQPVISRRVSLLNLPETVQRDVVRGKVTVTDAEQLARLEDPKMIGDILKRKSSDPFLDIRSAIDRMVAEQERMEKVQNGIAKIKAEGLRFIPMDEWEAGDEARILGPDTWMGLEHVDPKKHAKEPCVAYGVLGDGTRIQLCTEPERHVKKQPEKAPQSQVEPKVEPKAETKPQEDGEAKALSAAEKRRVAEAEREREATERRLRREKAEHDAALAAQRDRRSFIVELLEKRLPGKAEAMEFTVYGFIASARVGQSQAACRMLQLEPRRGRDGIDDWNGTLRQFADQGDAQRQRVGMALAFGSFEEDLNIQYRESWKTPDDLRHFEFLRSRGYAITKAEAKRTGLDEDKPKPAPKQKPPAAKKPATRKAAARK